MKQKTIYCCTACGNETYNWAGKCPSCGSWNTLKEITVSSKSKNSNASNYGVYNNKPQLLNEISSVSEIRYSTGIEELDRVLGGGAVTGSLVLVGGAPGIGKSTILLQLCWNGQ